MPSRARGTTGCCAFAVVIALVIPLAASGEASAASPPSQLIAGFAENAQQKEWFNTAFDTQPRFFGKVRGRVRLVTDTSARLDSTRRISSADRGELDAGQSILTRLTNEPVSSRLRVTAEPTLQLLFEWQPKEDPFACDNTNFPTFPGDEWFLRTDGGGALANGFCGAIEVTADDLNRIPIDLDLPQVFEILDRQFEAGYAGTQEVGQETEILEIKVCKIISGVFDFGIGDHCDLELSADVAAPLTTVAHTLDAQMCTDGQFGGEDLACLHRFGAQRALTFTDPAESYFTQAPCPDSRADVDVAVSNAAWDARLDDVTLRLAIDFNVHVAEDGDGFDVLSIPLPGSISLLSDPLPLRVSYPNPGPLHVGDLTPDDELPFVVLSPADVTIDEGSSATFSPTLADLCTPQDQLASQWEIDKATFGGPALTRTYGNDMPAPVHAGTLRVTDLAGNTSAPLPFTITVRNVAPSVQLTGIPTVPVPVGTPVHLTSNVSDPGTDRMSWEWSFGDGAHRSRTAADAQDRTDAQTHTYAKPGEYQARVTVGDGTDERSAGGTVIAFDPADKLVGSGTFTADDTSLHVPVGSPYSVRANVSYPRSAVRPDGRFESDFVIDEGGRAVASRLVATSYEWLFESGSTSRLQGAATVDGQGGYKFRVEVTRTAKAPATSRVTVSVWRPGFSTFADPDWRFGGPRKRGNIK